MQSTQNCKTKGRPQSSHKVLRPQSSHKVLKVHLKGVPKVHSKFTMSETKKAK